jgi:ATP-dependent DNA helicase RecG
LKIRPIISYEDILSKLILLEIKRTKRLVAKFRDSSGVIELVWFQGAKWMAEKLKSNTEYIVYGKATAFMGRFNMAHPEIDIVTPELLVESIFFSIGISQYRKIKVQKFR